MIQSTSSYIPNVPDQAHLIVSKDDLVRAIPYSNLAPLFSIITCNRKNEWNHPKMITDTWQSISVQINLAPIDDLLSKELKINAGRVQLLLFSKNMLTGKITSFEAYETKKQAVNVIERGKKFTFTCKFKIINGFTTLTTNNLYRIGLSIDSLVIKYFATDIFVGSNQSQINPPYKISKKIKKALTDHTFWFDASRNNDNEKEAVQKKAKLDVEDEAEAIAVYDNPVEDIVWDESDYLLCQTFPEAYIDIEGRPMLYPDVESMDFSL